MSSSGRGLQGVVVAESSMSKVYGDEGNLIYRGYSIHDLAKHSDFEEVVFLLWNDRLPKQSELDAFRRRAAEAREVPQAILEHLRSVSSDDSMALLRTATSMHSAYDSDAEDMSQAAAQRKALRLTASMATLVAAIGRAREARDFVDPDPSLGHAENFLYMLTGRRPEPAASRLLDQALVLHADHGFNASTFSARVTTSTLSDMHSAVVSAIGTLKGASHGGANRRVMEMLLEIDASGKEPETWVREALARGERIMGFGHRVYRVEDPRATHLRRASEQLALASGDDKWFRMTQRIERVVHEEKGLYPNVDCYSASAYYMLGIPVHLYTPIFALSRVAGWTGHILEQMRDNRLMRPRSEYVGATSRTYTPIAAR